MPHPVELLAEAADELFEAKRWYQLRDHGSSLRFAHAIDEAINAIAQSPLRWAVYRKNARRFLLHQFPFSVVYTFENQKVRIIAIAHARRRPGYWRDRT